MFALRLVSRLTACVLACSTPLGLVAVPLSAQAPTVSAANDFEVTRLEPIGNGQFRCVAPTGGGPLGEVVRFVEEGGRVIRMITGDSNVDRLRD